MTKVVATILLVGIIAIVALAVYAGQGGPLPTLAEPSPQQAALVALGHVARTEAQSIVAGKLQVITTLAAQAEAEPSIMRNAGWREQWSEAWYTVSQNSADSEVRAAAITCAVAGITGVALDFVRCSEKASRAINYQEKTHG